MILVTLSWRHHELVSSDFLSYLRHLFVVDHVIDSNWLTITS